MNILFIHQSFPCQFKHLARMLVDDGHNVHAISRHPNSTPGVTLHRRPPTQPHLRNKDFLYQWRKKNGEDVAAYCKAMRALGFFPHVVIAHSGWGEALLIKDVWPQARVVVAPEYYYNASGYDVGFDPEFPSPAEVSTALEQQNAITRESLDSADAIWIPTRFLATTFPTKYQERATILHEGIDTDYYAPDAHARLQLEDGTWVKQGDEVITFINRNLEPYRGFHTFVRALPTILQERPSAKVLIVGGNGSSYSGGGGFKDQFWQPLGDFPGKDRVHFLGSISEDQVKLVLQVSALHVYLTYPFVMGLSPLEAMSCGCLCLMSDTGPVTEFLTNGVDGVTVDMLSPSAIANSAISLLATPRQSSRSMKEQARQSIIDRIGRKSLIDLHRALVFGE